MKKLAICAALSACLFTQAYAASADVLSATGRGLTDAQKASALQLCKVPAGQQLEPKQAMCVAYVYGSLRAAALPAESRDVLTQLYRSKGDAGFADFRKQQIDACKAASGKADSGTEPLCKASVEGVLETVKTMANSAAKKAASAASAASTAATR